MTIRERTIQLLASVRTLVQMDAIARQSLRTLIAEFPGREGEIMYEWDSRKMQITRMTEND